MIKNPDLSTGPFARPFARSLAQLTCSLACSLTHTRARGTVFCGLCFSVLDYTVGVEIVTNEQGQRQVKLSFGATVV